MTRFRSTISLFFMSALIGACATEKSVRPGVNAEYEKTEVAQWVERFESESREIFREREAIARAAGLREGLTIADIGAGTGLFTELFSRSVGAAGHVYAVDIVPGFLEKIDADTKELGLTNVSTVLGGDRSVHLPAGSIDLVFICDTYHHFEYPRSMLGSIRQAMKPDGVLVIIDFDRIPGKSRPWVLDHVRAGKDDVIHEIETSGFQLIDQPATPFLSENYLLRFRVSSRGR